MAEETLYSILGLPSSDSAAADIRKAYLKKARETHPDKAGKGSEQTFNKVNEAFLVLSDEEKRREYDLTLARSIPKRPAPSRHPPSQSAREPSRPADDTSRATPGRPRAFYPAAQHRRRDAFSSSYDSSEDSQSDLDSPLDANERWRYRSEFGNTSEDDESTHIKYTYRRRSSFSSTSSDDSIGQPWVDRPTPRPQHFRQQSVPPVRPKWGFQPSPHVPLPQSPPDGPWTVVAEELDRREREKDLPSSSLHERRTRSRPPPVARTTMPPPPQGRSKSYQGYPRQQPTYDRNFSPPTYSPGYGHRLFLWGLTDVPPSRPSYEPSFHPSPVRPPPPECAFRHQERPKMPFLPSRAQPNRPPPRTSPSSPSARWHPPPAPPPPLFRSGTSRGSYSRSGVR